VVNVAVDMRGPSFQAAVAHPFVPAEAGIETCFSEQRTGFPLKFIPAKTGRE